MTADAFQERMRVLRGAFLEALAGDLPELRRHIDDSAYAEAAGIVHKIAGRAGTFGYPEVSECAGALEALLAEQPEPAGIGTALEALEAVGTRVIADADG
jgi:HPt (histidine-containing phosphotransfer) domain-containing protein